MQNRFKVNGSSEFVCQEFFLKGSSSDVVVHMLEEKWKLHKKYVMQVNINQCPIYTR